MEVWQDKIKGDWRYKFEYEGIVYTEKEFKSQLDAESTGALKQMQVIMGQEFIPESPESKEKPLFKDPNNQLPEKPITKSNDSIEKKQTPEKVSPKNIPEISSSQSFKEDANLESITQTEDPMILIPGGCFLVARKIFKSGIWLKHPFYLKTWLWILGQANHADHKKNNRTYRRGELITTYDEIIKGVAYYFNRQHIVPPLKQVRIILKWLVSNGMIGVQPLRQNDVERLTGADPRADLQMRTRADLKPQTRAYLGVRIIVINYDTYQDLKNYKGRPSNENQGIPSVQLGHNNKNGTRKKDNIYSQNFLNYWKAYPNRAAKKKAFEAWQKLEKKEDMETLLPILLDAIERQKQAKEIKKANGEFVSEWPNPATWLNGRRWEDEVEIKKRWDHAR